MSQCHYKVSFDFLFPELIPRQQNNQIKHAHLRTRCPSSEVRLGRQHKLITDAVTVQEQKYSSKNARKTSFTFWASFASDFWTFLFVWEGFSSTVKTTESQLLVLYTDSFVKVLWPCD